MTALEECLQSMNAIYRADPENAVRSQKFIMELHKYIQADLQSRLTKKAKRRGIEVLLEKTVLGSHKSKDVDVGIYDPVNGPLMMIGVRSQMSSVGKNVLTYYQDIVGECISLQDRYPMATYGYCYLMPLNPINGAKKKETITHGRFARMYDAISGRSGKAYRDITGVYDEFAYLVVDFDQAPPALRDDIVLASVPGVDLSVTTFVDRLVARHVSRNLFWEIFESDEYVGV